MAVSGLKEFENELLRLSKRAVEVRQRNKRAVRSDEQKQAGRRVYSLEEDISPESKPDTNEELRLLNYSMREYERWGFQTKGAKAKQSITGDFQTIARNSYRKEVQNLPKTVSREVKGFVTDDGKVKLDDNPDLVNSLVESVDRTAKKRYMVRKQKLEKQAKVDLDAGFINDKNKKFNAKMNLESQ